MGLGTYLRLDTFDAERAVTSYLYGPKVLVGTRAFGTAYLVAVLVGALATTPSFRYFISFFTNISFCALIVYYMRKNGRNGRKEEAESGARYTGYSTGASLYIIPLVYWSILRRHQKPHYGVYEWATISEHSTDGVLMLLEIISTRMQMEIRHLPFTVLFMILYLFTTFVHYWTTGTWVYPFLDYKTYGWKLTGPFYVGVAVALVVVYLIVWKLHNVKESLGVKRRRRKEVVLGQDQDPGRSLELEQEQGVQGNSAAGSKESVSTASATTVMMPEKEDKEIELQSTENNLKMRLNMPPSSFRRTLCNAPSLSNHARSPSDPLAIVRQQYLASHSTHPWRLALLASQQQTRFKSTNESNQPPGSSHRNTVAKSRLEEKLEDKDDPRKEAVDDTKKTKTFHPARLPIVLCHGFSGFDSLGTNPDFKFDYWYGVREALGEIGCTAYAAKVPPFAAIQKRAEKLKEYIEQTVPKGTELNLIGHSMGGLDCRHLISHLQSPHFKVRSLTTLATPHHGSSFADYVMSDIVGRVRLETFWMMLKLVGIERGAAENLTTYSLRDEFNPKTPDDPEVAYFSYGASFKPGLFSRFRLSWRVIMDREGPNDGLVSVKSAQWGKYVRTIPNADHMDLMNWVNALAWSRARFPWILGGSSHDPEGRPKGAFETDNDDEDENAPREEPPLFNAIELYLEISDMLYKHGL
ncbi:hypothetical protein BGZ51_002678 [Haplosporangium sp. Z 767]|nr:hypothetical protein BGZ51_002678 [Haplosporangium sp. Z 767]KAF9188810.1 hypothetical protein BGZ50_001123 [Haplosporangium sp. Z 11]